jgi:hypothetical protein
VSVPSHQFRSVDPLAYCLPHVDDIPFKYIDPRLLCNHHSEENIPIEKPRAFTIDTQPEPPSSAPVAAAHRDGSYTAVASTSHQLPPPPSEAPAQRAPQTPSRGGRNVHVRTQSLSPRHKKRRAKALEGLTQQYLYNSLPTADREYFHKVVTNLSNAPYLVSPQSLEPNVGSSAGSLLISPQRTTGPGAAAARESVYAVLVDRPSAGAYVCWICGEGRADRRLNRALDHVRGHFDHRPYHCSEIHLDQSNGPTSSLPLTSVW